MARVGELSLLPIAEPGWQAPPTYFIGAGGLGYLVVTWLMHFLSAYRPEGSSMEDFNGAGFLVIDTGEGENKDLPPNDWAKNRLLRMTGHPNTIFSEVGQNLFPGIREFLEVTPVLNDIIRKSLDLSTGAGATRPLGRMAFHYNWEKVFEALDALVKAPVKTDVMRYGSPSLEVEQGSRRHFFVVSSLAGGTGSSCFLDIAATLRLLRNQSFRHEEWMVTGVFTLAEVLSVDKAINEESHRIRMKANTYAALKELNHYLCGNPFSVRYGRHGEHPVCLTNTANQETLYDLVFLVDTPNQDNQPLSGRKEVATFLAQALLLLSLTPLQKEFTDRLINDIAMLVFEQSYPPRHDGEDGKERQKRLFSSLGLATLSLPVQEYLEIAIGHVALELFNQIIGSGARPDPTAHVEPMLRRINLTEESLEQAFMHCMRRSLPPVEDALGMIRDAREPVQELQRLIAIVGQQANTGLSTEAQVAADQEFYRLQALLSQELTQLEKNGMVSVVPLVLDRIRDRLQAYAGVLEREHQEAVVRAQSGLAPAGVLSSQAQDLSVHPDFVQLRQAMEQAWQHRWTRWRHRLGKGVIADLFEIDLEHVLELFAGAEETMLRLRVWPSKMTLVFRLLNDLEKLRADYKQKLSAAERIRSELTQNIWQLEKQVEYPYRHELAALSPIDYMKEIFTPYSPVERQISAWIEELRTEGLALKDGSKVNPSDWPTRSWSDIAEALRDFCRFKILHGPPPSPDDDLGSTSSPLFQVGLDHRYFLPQSQPTRFTSTVLEWKRRAKPSLLFGGTVPESRSYLVSGCRVHDGSQTWDDALNLTGLNMFSGGTKNKVSLLTVVLGFPIQSVARIGDWFKRAYVPQLRWGWPVHMVNREELCQMVEPYLDWLALPTKQEATAMVKEAESIRVCQFLTGGSGGTLEVLDLESLGYLPRRLHPFFHEKIHETKFQPKEHVLTLLRNNKRAQAFLRAKLAADTLGNAHDCMDTFLSSLVQGKVMIESESGEYTLNETYCREAMDVRELKDFFLLQTVGRPKQVTKDELISMISTNESVCRFFVKRMVEVLLAEHRRTETRARLNQGEFDGFFRGVLEMFLA